MCRLLAEKIGAFEVDGQRPVPGFGPGADKRLVYFDSRVVDQYIQTPKPIESRRYQALVLHQVAHIGGQRQRFSAR